MYERALANPPALHKDSRTAEQQNLQKIPQTIPKKQLLPIKKPNQKKLSPHPGPKNKIQIYPSLAWGPAQTCSRGPSRRQPQPPLRRQNPPVYSASPQLLHCARGAPGDSSRNSCRYRTDCWYCHPDRWARTLAEASTRGECSKMTTRLWSR